MATKKKVKKKSNKKLTSDVIIVLSVIGIVFVCFFGFWLKSYIPERKSLSELADVGKNLEVVYNKLLAVNDGNVQDSYFGHECSEASVEIGRGQIVCSVVGMVTLKHDDSLERAKQVLEQTVNSSGLNLHEQGKIYNGEYYSAVTLVYKSPYDVVDCDGHYAQSNLSKKWIYSISCRKTVPDFLPGYTIEK